MIINSSNGSEHRPVKTQSCKNLDEYKHTKHVGLHRNATNSEHC